ncbi:MAG: hypothetical protein KF832_01625 [Caldilineaceae bacterium]|nr:hypothetical protein [Caldilineaceae bacterium]
MTTVCEAEIRLSLYQLVDTLMVPHEPRLHPNQVSTMQALSAEEWQLIDETLALSNLPEIKRAILDGVKTPFREEEE